MNAGMRQNGGTETALSLNDARALPMFRNFFVVAVSHTHALSLSLSLSLSGSFDSAARRPWRALLALCCLQQGEEESHARRRKDQGKFSCLDVALPVFDVSE